MDNVTINITEVVENVAVSIQETVENTALSVTNTRGSQGEPGIPGLPGLKGDPGDPGLPGERGADGLPGLPGLPGANGVDGYTPVKGVDYFDGLPGTPGEPGIQGEQGLQGSQGIQGIPGVQGIQGAPGTNGTDGADGVGVPPGGTTEQILSKIDSTDFNTHWVDKPTGSGSGDVVGPAASVDGHLVVFDGTTGKLVKDGGAVPSGGISYPIIDPTTIPGCILWLDADQIVASDQAAIGTWTDKSTVGNHATQTVAGNKPTFCTNMQGGKPALFFDNDDYLNLGINITSNTTTVFIVWNFWYKAGYSTLLSLPKYGVYSYLAGTAHWGIFRSEELPSGSTSFDDTFKISGVVFSNTTSTTLYTNGKKRIAPGGTNNVTTSSKVGWDGADFQHHYGMISEIIIYNTVLSEANRLAIERSLSTKYKIRLIQD
jgi:hypothetical protein